MINLLFVLPWFAIGGSENVVFELARGIDKNRFRPIIFAIKPGPLEVKFNQAGLETIVSQKEPGRGHFQLIAQISNTIKKYAIDIVLPHHMTSLYYSYFPARLFNRTQLYFTEHSVSGIESMSVPYRLLTIVLLFLSSGCIAISNELSECYIKSLMVRRSKIFHIPNAVDVANFETLGDIKGKRKELRIRQGDVVIGTVANIRAVKNHKNLLYAFRKVINHLENVVLVLVGSGPLDNEIRKLADELSISDKVLFLGHRSDVNELYHVFDIFCLSSLSEGFPVSILEAMASNVPVIATNVSGNKEIIKHGKNGILVPSDSPNELANALVMLARNQSLRKNLSGEAYNAVRNRFDSKKWVKQYEALFSS